MSNSITTTNKELPKEWPVVRIGDILSLEYGKGLPANERSKGYYPVFGSNGIVGYHEQFLVKGPGIVVGRKGTIGAVKWVDSDFWPIDTTYFVKIKNENVFLKWLFFKLKQSNLPRLNQSDVVPGLKRELVYHITIPLPPLPEQRRIAEVLGTVDSAIQKVGGAIESTERLKKGLMQRLLTGGIGHERFKETDVGRVPEEWEVVRLGDVAYDFVGGGTPSTSNPDYWNGKIAWMTSAYINGKMVTSGQRYITEKGLNESSTHLVPHGNLLVATRVGIGKAATNSIDIAISQDLTGVIIKKDKIIADYGYWFLINNSSRLKSLAQGSTIKGILKDDLTNLKLPLPPLSEQRRIAEVLGTIDRKLELERRRKEKLERVKKGIMNDLLTGRKRTKFMV